VVSQRDHGAVDRPLTVSEGSRDDGLARSDPPHPAQRLEPVGSGEDGVVVSEALDEHHQQFRCDVRQVGGDDGDEVVVDQRDESCEEAAERTFARMKVRHDVEADGSESSSITADGDDRIGPSAAQGIRGPSRHGLLAHREQRLVPPHPPAPASRQHRAGEGACRDGLRAHDAQPP
jgi:hypothetical protein